MNFLTMIIYITLLLTLVANPAPQGIGPFEIIIALLMLTVLLFCLRSKLSIRRTNSVVLFLWLLYIISLGLSAGYGLIQGAHPYKVLGSIAPFLVFTPIILYTFAKPQTSIITTLVNALIIVGTFQALFLLYLYFGRSISLQNVDNVIQYRTTYLDPRTTLPFLLASATLPLTKITLSNLKSFLWIIVVGLSFLAAFTTQTRSLILAVIFGILVYFSLALLSFALNNIKFSKKTVIKAISAVFITLIIGLLVMVQSNTFQALTSAVVYRSVTASDNGRIEDEWKPAIKQWSNGSTVNYLIGMGLGIPFENKVLGNQTFMHNILLYNLIYGGFFGLIIILGMYIFLVTILFSSGLNEPLIWSSLACILAMLLYAQFFAVFKSLGYNCMLCYLWAIAVNLAYIKFKYKPPLMNSTTRS